MADIGEKKLLCKLLCIMLNKEKL